MDYLSEQERDSDTLTNYLARRGVASFDAVEVAREAIAAAEAGDWDREVWGRTKAREVHRAFRLDVFTQSFPPPKRKKGG